MEIDWLKVADGLSHEAEKMNREADLSSAKGFREGAIMFNTIGVLLQCLTISLLKGLKQ